MQDIASQNESMKPESVRQSAASQTDLSTSFIKPSYVANKISPTLHMANLQRELQENGQTVYKFGFGQSPFPVPQGMQEALAQNTHQKDYLHVQGLPALRQAIASWYEKYTKATIDPLQVIVGPGSKELIYSFQNVFDGNLILPNPSWVSYVPQSKFAQNQHFYVPSYTENGEFSIDMGELEKVLQQLDGQNNYLLLNYPNNPTGATLNRAQLQEITDIARNYGLFILSDEIYSETCFSEEGHSSIAEFYPERTIITNGCSKWLGAGGWRLGFMIIPKTMSALLASMNMLQSETFSAVSSPIQFAAIKGFDTTPQMESFLKYQKEILQMVSKIFHDRLTESGIKCTQAGGAFYIFVNFDHLPKAQELREEYAQDQDTKLTFGEWVFQDMLKQSNVALLHGKAFGRPEDELSFRLSYTDFDGGDLQEKAQKEAITEEFIKKNALQAMKGLDQLINYWIPSCKA